MTTDNKWVSVNDKQPPMNERLLVYLKDGTIHDIVFNFQPNLRLWLDHITHWMYAPLPPRKEDEQ